jgi:threonyl-tRNA synthetase
MKELASQDLAYEHQMWPRQDAIDFFTRRGEPLKVQLIEEKTAGRPDVSVYTIKDRTRSSTSASARTCRRRTG